jgi:hypothetical protein
MVKATWELSLPRTLINFMFKERRWTQIPSHLMNKGKNIIYIEIIINMYYIK